MLWISGKTGICETPCDYPLRLGDRPGAEPRPRRGAGERRRRGRQGRAEGAFPQAQAGDGRRLNPEHKAVGGQFWSEPPALEPHVLTCV